MKPIIKIENVSKLYRIGGRKAAYGTLRDTVAETLLAPLRRLRRRNGGEQREELWALRNVSFEVAVGEVCGIIGSNGAGKSTLLKILSRITEPTTGRGMLYGRVGSLLEVGTGFHPELTGRENVYLNGAILGMKRAEIMRKFDEIVAFSEIERFIDTPVKFYSSGMYMRLAFAVAAHLEPEILIVDEVLAVGDLAFQKKCLGKMGEVAGLGRTVLFVSHNMVALQSLCNRAVWLHNGEVRDQGSTRDVLANYLRTSISARAEQIWDDIGSAPGNEAVRVRSACVRPAHGDTAEPITVRTPILMEFEYWNLVPGAHLNLSVVISTESGFPIFNTGPNKEPIWFGKPFPTGLFRNTFEIPGDLLNDGTHRVQLMVVKDQSVVLFNIDDVLVFDVEESFEARSGFYGKVPGAVRPILNWTTELVDPGAPAR